MQKDNFTAYTVFKTLNRLNIMYSLGGLSLVDYFNHSILDKNLRSQTTIYLFEKSFIKLFAFVVILFFKGLIIKPEFSPQNKRFKIRKKYLKKF